MDDPELERDPVRELSAEFAPNEVALALTLTQCAAEWWMSLAVSMSGRLPATWSALSQGTIDLARAKLIDLWTTPLDDDLAQAVERKVLVRAGQQTTGQLRASLQRAVISVDPSAAERRRTQAERNARVELTGEDSGTAALSGHFLPAAQASAAWARISGMAELMKGNGAGGGIDLLRAQVFVGLLLGTLPQPPDEAAPGNTDPPGAPPDDRGTPSGDGGSNAPAGAPDDDPESGSHDQEPRSGLDGADPGRGHHADPRGGPHAGPGSRHHADPGREAPRGSWASRAPTRVRAAGTTRILGASPTRIHAATPTRIRTVGPMTRMKAAGPAARVQAASPAVSTRQTFHPAVLSRRTSASRRHQR